MRKCSLIIPFALMPLASPPASAQFFGPTAPPPKVMRVYIEEVKPGKGAAHEKVEATWVQTLAQAKDPSHYFAMTSASGPAQA